MNDASHRLEVRSQARLPFKRMLELCLDTISYRLFRSIVTVVIIILAIAFLASIMAEGYVGRAVRDAVTVRVRRQTAYSRFLSDVSTLWTDEDMLAFVAGAKEGTTGMENLDRWAQFETPADRRAFFQQTRRVVAYRDFFEGISVGRRALLVEGRHGLEIFGWLQTAANFQTFAARLEPMRSLKLPGGAKAFQTFIEQEWPPWRARLERMNAQRAAAIERIGRLCPGGASAGLSAAVAAGAVEHFFAQIKEAGVQVDPAEIPDILQGKRYQKDLDWAFDQLRKPPVHNAWNREFQESFSPTDALRACAESSSRVAWVAGKLAGDPEFDAAKLRRVALDYAEQARLQAAEQRLEERYGRSEGLSGKSVWLILVSFVVCIVGIANAMLMSVLERFKEIATMKCLGARNGTIGFLFVTESTIMGVIGGAIGTVVGVVIILASETVLYGGLVFARFPGLDLLWTCGVCLACSLFLSSFAAIYPARVAARMAPMDAMRVD